MAGQSTILNTSMKTGLRFTIPGTDYGKIRSGVRPGKIIVDRRTRQALPRKAKHKKRTDW